MDISMARQGDAMRIDVGAQLGVANRQELKHVVLGELEHGERKFLIDFRQTGYIDSSGLGVLVSLSKKIRERQGELRLLNLSDDLRALFRLTLLDRMFQLGGDAPPGGDATAGSSAPLKPRSPGPLPDAAEATFLPPDEVSPP
jgi:anti-sigma B factor antagonist